MQLVGMEVARFTSSGAGAGTGAGRNFFAEQLSSVASKVGPTCLCICFVRFACVCPSVCIFFFCVCVREGRGNEREIEYLDGYIKNR